MNKLNFPFKKKYKNLSWVTLNYLKGKGLFMVNELMAVILAI